MKKLNYLKFSIAVLSIVSLEECLAVNSSFDDSAFREQVSEIEANLTKKSLYRLDNPFIDRINTASESFKNKLLEGSRRVEKIEALKESLRELREDLYGYNHANEKLQELGDSKKTEWQDKLWTTTPGTIIRELENIEQEYSLGSFFLAGFTQHNQSSLLMV